MPFTAAEVAKALYGQVLGDARTLLNGFAPADRAQPGDLTFAENEDYFRRAEGSAATAIIIDGNFTSNRKVLIRAAGAGFASAKFLPLFFPAAFFPGGFPPPAITPATATVEPTAHIGPYCVLSDNVRIGAR